MKIQCYACHTKGVKSIFNSKDVPRIKTAAAPYYWVYYCPKCKARIWRLKDGDRAVGFIGQCPVFVGDRGYYPYGGHRTVNGKEGARITG